jgi:hypothetical protein
MQSRKPGTLLSHQDAREVFISFSMERNMGILPDDLPDIFFFRDIGNEIK